MEPLHENLQEIHDCVLKELEYQTLPWFF